MLICICHPSNVVNVLKDPPPSPVYSDKDCSKHRIYFISDHYLETYNPNWKDNLKLEYTPEHD